MSLSQNKRLRNVAREVCRELRRSQTNAANIFWQAVRNRQFYGLKFYRQYPLYFDYIGKETFFIADFFCFEKRLVIEIDGKIHEYRKDHDELRTFIINMMGIEVLRFSNKEIEHEFDGVLKNLEKKTS